MLSRLTRTGRWRAGWCVALAYLFCAMAPSLSFAFADGSRQAPCIVEDHGPAMFIHEAVMVHHVHDGSGVHAHSQASIGDSATGAHADAGLPVKSPRKHADSRCCNLVSASAIPAAEIVVVAPAASSSRRKTESERVVADNTLAGLYRPPIA